MFEKQNDAQTMLDAGRVNCGPQQALNSSPYVVIPDGYTIHDLEHLLPQPVRIKQSVTLHDQESFVAYVNQFREVTTAIFYNQGRACFRAVLDYHGPENMGQQNPQWCSHTAAYTPKTTPEWAAWAGWNERHCDQTAFATFLEKHIDDVQDGTALLKVALNMQIHREVRFTSAKRADSMGTELLTYQEDVQGTATEGKIAIPPAFILSICPFIGGAQYSIGCRFRFHLKDGKLALWYEMEHPEKLIESALEQIREGIEEGTTIKTFAGE